MDRDTVRFLLFVVAGIVLYALLIRWSYNESILEYLPF